MWGKTLRIFLATTDAGKEEGERGCAEEAEVAFTMSHDSKQKLPQNWKLYLKHPPPHDHHGRYADLAAGKKVRAPDETELSEKEMKWAIFSSTQNLYWKTCL